MCVGIDAASGRSDGYPPHESVETSREAELVATEFENVSSPCLSRVARPTLEPSRLTPTWDFWKVC